MSPSRNAAAADCDFCDIVWGQDSSVEVLCEGRTWMAFFPLSPATPGHTLIIPRLHVADLWHVKGPLAADLMSAVIRVGHAIETALVPEGMNLVTSAGEAAEQTVFHLHLHVVPRWRRDGFGKIWPTDQTFEDSEIEDAADRIRTACSAEEVNDDPSR